METGSRILKGTLYKPSLLFSIVIWKSVKLMTHIKRFFNQNKILVLLLVLLAMSIGLNVYLFFGVIKPLQQGRGEEETHTLTSGFASEMWDEFSVELTPNRAVLYRSSDRQFKVSVTASYWAPFDYGPRPFYFKIYDTSARALAPKLVGEKTVIANKSKDEMDYEIPIFNFTVTLDVGGLHLYSIVGAAWPDITLTNCDCMATFAINIM